MTGERLPGAGLVFHLCLLGASVMSQRMYLRGVSLMAQGCVSGVCLRGVPLGCVSGVCLSGVSAVSLRVVSQTVLGFASVI